MSFTLCEYVSLCLHLRHPDRDVQRGDVRAVALQCKCDTFCVTRVLEGDIRHVAHDVSWVFNVAVWSRRNCAARLYNKGTNHSNASLDSRCANAFISAGCVMTSCCSTLQMIKSPWLHVRAAKNCWAHTGASWGVVMCWGPITSFLWYCLKSLFFLVWFFLIWALISADFITPSFCTQYMAASLNRCWWRAEHPHFLINSSWCELFFCFVFKHAGSLLSIAAESQLCRKSFISTILHVISTLQCNRCFLWVTVLYRNSPHFIDPSVIW